MSGLPSFVIESLDVNKHDRKSLASGNEPLDEYLRKYARQDSGRGFTRVFVAAQGNRILGYYTLSASALDLGRAPPEFARRLPKYPEVPCMRIGRLAVDAASRGMGLGRILLIDAFARILAVSKQAGIHGVLVDAKDNAAEEFYAHFGFVTVTGRLMFIPLETAAVALGDHA